MKWLYQKRTKKLMNYVVNKKKKFLSSPFQEKLLTVQKLVYLYIKLVQVSVITITLLSIFVKPIILSTGMNSLKTIEPAVKIIRKYKLPYALLHCTNVYPTPHKLVRLNAMLELKKKFKTIADYQTIAKLFTPL